MAQGLAVEWIIRPAVFEFFFEAAANLDAVFRRDGDIASVKEAMEITSQKKTVVHGVRPALVKRLDVGCFESREGMLLRDCAGTVVGIRDHYPESPLPQARSYEYFISISSRIINPLFGHHIGWQLRQSHLDIFPERFPWVNVCNIVFALLNRWLPIGGHRNPI